MTVTIRYPAQEGPRGLNDFPSRSDYHDCLMEKYAECHPAFIDSILADGIQLPVAVGGEGQIREGHHRWAVAYVHDLPCPVDDDPEASRWSHGYIWSDGTVIPDNVG